MEWNNLYMPESCFRLNEILEPAASNQAPVQKVAPGSPTAPTTTHVTVQPAVPALPQPTQYTIPTTPRTYVDLHGAGSEATDRHVGENGLGEQQPLYPGIYVQGSSNHQQGQERLDQGGYQNAGGQQQHQQQQPPQGWNQGSLPDINPANINLDQFNGHVYPIHTGGYAGEDQGAAGYQTTAGQFAASSQYSLNITQGRANAGTCGFDGRSQARAKKKAAVEGRVSCNLSPHWKRETITHTHTHTQTHNRNSVPLCNRDRGINFAHNKRGPRDKWAPAPAVRMSADLPLAGMVRSGSLTLRGEWQGDRKARVSKSGCVLIKMGLGRISGDRFRRDC